jgi:H+/Cl- antiporter ClcA
MFVGALLGALLVLHARIVVPLAIAFVVIALVSVASYRAGRSDPPWTRVEG